MTPRKLSDSDKQEIIERYREPGETTVTLADRYGVSNSTISRILKNSFSDDEYKALVQQKREARFPNSHSEPEPTESEPAGSAPAPNDLVQEPDVSPQVMVPAPIKLRRRRSSAPESSETQAEATQLELLNELESPAYEPMVSFEESSTAETKVIEEMLGETILDEEDYSDLDEDDDDDEDDLDEDDLDEDELDMVEMPVTRRRLGATGLIQVLPLSEASLPKICYLVVDRSAELITRPLREFSDLGQIPVPEIQQKTLPVFDNHRVARRFSNRSQRVIKIPDGRMLQKTSTCLQAKGITRLLIDGQVYSL
jgi:transposase-like protein